MPSEDRIKQVLEAFRGPIEAFHGMLSAAAQEVRRSLAGRQATREGRLARIAAELGPLAAGRIDVERFAAVFDNHRETHPAAIEVIERVLSALSDLAARGEGLSVVEVPAGGNLYESVSRTLGEIGRAFGAARALQHAGTKRYPSGSDEGFLDSLPFSRWTKNERQLALPLVVTVHGADLRAPALAEFLDGRQRIVLVVDGDCAPAPLARLIAPGTFVLQTHDGTGLDRLAAWNGPGIGALVPESAARFVHDPLAGAAVCDRIKIEYVPDRAPRRTIGGLSAAQQTEELQLLRSLATRPADAGEPVAAGSGPAAPAEPADKLAAWLLSRVDLSDLG